MNILSTTPTINPPTAPPSIQYSNSVHPDSGWTLLSGG
ncbi:hypothetical protein ANMWB30_24640 [Arthrobacter sp. MWB30]|nr:hypothetical protein ANMWB30_24640 [Arthrobacter sp. MWB30]